MGKIKTFIKNIPSKVTLTITSSIANVKLVHEKLLQLDPVTNTVPYFEAYKWVIEVLYYGLLAMLVYFGFILTGWKRWLILPISLGILRLLWLDMVENTANAIKGKK